MDDELLPKLMIIDDDELVHKAMRGFFGRQYCVACFSSGEEALAAAKHELFPVVILDLRMEGMPGLKVLEVLKKMQPSQQVIICTGHATQETAVQAINLQAFRYLMKPIGLSELRDAVSEALRQFERQIALSGVGVSCSRLRQLGLSKREAEVAAEILEGKSNLQIAKTLGVSPRTIEKHVERVFAHFQISNRASLAPRIREWKAEDSVEK